MDNTGNYVEYDELIAELFEDGSSLVSNETTTLSAKVVDSGGDIYTFSGGTPQINDVLYQGGEIAVIIGQPSGTQIQINKTGAENAIVNGSAKFLRSARLTKRRATGLINSHMQFIDRATRNFFNKRSGTFHIEGDNGPTLYLPVPIIEITSMKLNSSDIVLTEGEDNDFVAFSGRQSPTDDRKNPMIKLNVGRGRSSIFQGITNRIFARHTLTEIIGSFGYLEPDGSTPEPIKRAMKLLIFKELNVPLSSTGSTGTTQAGPLRRLKVDLHEQEFFASGVAERDKKSHLSGIHEVDVILAQYKSPIIVSGSIPRFNPQANYYVE